MGLSLQNLLSLLRAIGTLIGAYLVGHAVFGHTVSADALQVVGGTVLTLASTIWGIATKTSTIEGLESSARSILTALGGLGVSAGVISGEQLAAILAAIIPLATFLQSVLSKTKNQQIATGTTTISATTLKAVPKAAAIILILLFAGTIANAQSMFSPYPKPEHKTNLFAKSVVGPFDSIPAGAPSYTAFRFQGPTVMYATSFKNLNQADVFTFFFLSYQKGTFDAPSNKYYTNWAIAIGAGEGGQFAPSSVSAVTALALALSTQKIGKTNLPFLLTVGAIYNLTAKQGMPAVGPGIPLNN